MAPAAITEDYYKILEVEQTARVDLIVKSYKRLALKLHPDHNSRQDATEAFQRLARAYETLKDENERRKYDLIYPSIKRKNGSSQSTQKQNSNSVPKSRSETSVDAAQLAAELAALQKSKQELEKSKQERNAQWHKDYVTFDSTMFEIRRVIRRLENEIKDLDGLLAAEAVVAAQKDNWGAWLQSMLYKKREESDEEKDRKDRTRQERRIEKDMKERRLETQKARLTAIETTMSISKEEIDDANSKDEAKIRTIRNQIWVKETLQREERERAERDKRAKQAQQEQEKKEREELRRKHKERMEEQAKRRREPPTERRGRRTRTASCRHDGWWLKVQGRTECPECDETWTYLLQCPNCEKKLCPRCLAEFRQECRYNSEWYY